MKILFYTDNHFCETTSIIRGHGNKYTLRLENQIESLNWVESKAVELGCEEIICIGDFFDKPTLTDQELTALKDIVWADLPHKFLVGNHESSVNGLQYNSTNALKGKQKIIITEPQKRFYGDLEVCFLPYIIESDRKPLVEYFGPLGDKPRLILSHNDLKGVQMGPVVSRIGFSLAEIKECCSLFLNGHLHNGLAVSDNAVNLGNLTGKDFNEDASKYKHQIMVIDTETLECKLYENPFAFNFYKPEIHTVADIAALTNITKSHLVLSIKCVSSLLPKVKKVLEDLKRTGQLIESRITTIYESGVVEEGNITELSVDHLARFVECCREKINNSEALETELAEICK